MFFSYAVRMLQSFLSPHLCSLHRGNIIPPPRTPDMQQKDHLACLGFHGGEAVDARLLSLESSFILRQRGVLCTAVISARRTANDEPVSGVTYCNEHVTHVCPKEPIALCAIHTAAHIKGHEETFQREMHQISGLPAQGLMPAVPPPNSAHTALYTQRHTSVAASLFVPPVAAAYTPLLPRRSLLERLGATTPSSGPAIPYGDGSASRTLPPPIHSSAASAAAAASSAAPAHTAHAHAATTERTATVDLIFGEGTLPSIKSQRILPTPANGDCPFYTIILSTLCPVAHDTDEFNRREKRFLEIPLPIGNSVVIPPLPAFVYTHRPLPNMAYTHIDYQLNFREFLHEYRNMNLPVPSRASNIWLQVGPNGEQFDGTPIDQVIVPVRYRAAIRHLNVMQEHMRQVLAAYRRNNAEFALKASELSDIRNVEPILIDIVNITSCDFNGLRTNDDALRVNYLRRLATNKKNISVDDISVFASLLGLTLVVRNWVSQGNKPPARRLPAGSVDSVGQVFDPLPQWEIAHGKRRPPRAILQVIVYHVNAGRHCGDAGDNHAYADHFEAIYVPSADPDEVHIRGLLPSHANRSAAAAASNTVPPARHARTVHTPVTPLALLLQPPTHSVLPVRSHAAAAAANPSATVTPLPFVDIPMSRLRNWTAAEIALMKAAIANGVTGRPKHAVALDELMAALFLIGQGLIREKGSVLSKMEEIKRKAREGIPKTQGAGTGRRRNTAPPQGVPIPANVPVSPASLSIPAAVPLSAVLSTPPVPAQIAPVFTPEFNALIATRWLAGVDGSDNFETEYEQLATRFVTFYEQAGNLTSRQTLEQIFNATKIKNVFRQLTLNKHKQQLTAVPPTSAPVSVRSFSVVEVALLKKAVIQYGISHALVWREAHNQIALVFHRRVPCTYAVVYEWFHHYYSNSNKTTMNNEVDHQAAANITEQFVKEELTNFCDNTIAPHRGKVTGRNRGTKKSVADEQSATDTIPVTSLPTDRLLEKGTSVDTMLARFWDMSATQKFRTFRRKLDEDSARSETGTAEIDAERIEDFQAQLGKPVEDAVRTRCIRRYNQYMDPLTPLLQCASCGIYEFNSVNSPLNMNKSTGAETTLLTDPIAVNPDTLEKLLLTDEQLKQYQDIDEKYRPCFNVLCVPSTSDDPNEKLKATYYNLFPQLISVNANTKVMHARFCVSCHTCIGNHKDRKLPVRSLASGLDFGTPSAVGLLPLSFLESQLIARYRLFATLVKLVAPFSMQGQARQTAFSGHTIVFPHNGPNVCATQLPNVQDIHGSVSVIFIGTKAQYHVHRDALCRRFRGIFQVRATVVRDWLLALKGVGNPMYADVTIPAANDPCWRAIEKIPDELLETARITDCPVARMIDRMATSDVAHVRETVLEPASSSAVPNTEAQQAAAAAGDGESLLSETGIGSVFVTGINDAIEIQLVDAPAVIKTEDASGEGADSDAGAAERVPNNPGMLSGRIAMFDAVHVALHGPIRIQPAVRESEEKPEHLIVSLINDTPINEYGGNDQLLLGTFPHLFMLGRKMPAGFQSSVTPDFRKMLLRYWDGRFAKNHHFLFLLFNQLQRHKTAGAIAARVRSSPGQVEEFLDLVTQHSFNYHLAEARDHPDGPMGEKLAKQLAPLIRVIGAKIPYSAGERAAALPKLIAYSHLFGLPSFFFTVSPSDLDQPLTVRLAITPSLQAVTAHLKSTEQPPDPTTRELIFPMPALADRAKLLAENPVAAAEVFQRLMETMLKTLLCMQPYRTSVAGSSPAIKEMKDREQGLLGKVTAHFSVFEVQGRGTLHAHMLVWTDLPPSLLADIAQYPELVKCVQPVIDEITQASIPLQYHAADNLRRQTNVDPPRSGLSMSTVPTPTRNAAEQIVDVLSGGPPRPSIPDSFSADSIDPLSFEDRAYTIAASVQRHIKHALTCRKGIAGKFGCRMSMPQALHVDPTGPVQLAFTKSEHGQMTVQPMESVQPKEFFHPTEMNVLPPADRRILAWELCRPLVDDGYVVAFNLVMSAVLACNMALYHLGSKMQAKSTLFYLLKYMTKDATALANCLAALYEARRHVAQYPSKAADSGTPMRTAQHMLNRLLNNISGKAEVSAEMAAAALLGMPSTMASHDTHWCFIRTAVAFVLHARSPIPPAADAPASAQEQNKARSRAINRVAFLDNLPDAEVEIEDESQTDDILAEEEHPRPSEVDDATGAVKVEPPDADGEHDMPWAESDELNDAAGINAIGDNHESLQIFKHPTAKTIDTIPQYLHYMYRGHAMGHFCYYEYTALVTVESIPKPKKKKKKGKKNKDGQQPSSDASDSGVSEGAESDMDDLERIDDLAASDAEGKEEPAPAQQSEHAFAKNFDMKKTFPFDAEHPMYRTHRQRMRPNPVVPCLAGRSPPTYPGPEPDLTPAARHLVWQKSSQRYAEYMLVLFVPWQTVGGTSTAIGPPIALDFETFCQFFRQYSDSSEPHLIGRSECIAHLSRGLFVGYDEKRALTVWRNRATKRWGARDDVPAPPTPVNERQLDIDTSRDTDAVNIDLVQGIIDEMRISARVDDPNAGPATVTQQRAAWKTMLLQEYQRILTDVMMKDDELAGRPNLPPSHSHVRLREDGTAAEASPDAPFQPLTLEQMFQIQGGLKSDESVDRVAPIAAPQPTGDDDDKTEEDGAGGRGGPGNSIGDDQAVDRSLISLNAEQQRVITECVAWMKLKLLSQQKPAEHMIPEPLFLIVHGCAGTGKSTFARALSAACTLVDPFYPNSPPVCMVTCAAPTGIAATLVTRGRTLHSLLSMDVFKGADSARVNGRRVTHDLNVTQRSIVQDRLRAARILLVDEVSMVGSAMLGTIDARLRSIAEPTKRFGGLCVVLMGDFFQLPAVGDKALPVAALEYYARDLDVMNEKNFSALSVNGGRLFAEVKLRKLTQQMRVNENDVEHTALVKSFQQTTGVSPVTKALLKRLEEKQLTSEDIRDDHSWMEASVVVPTNVQRECMLPLMVEHYARFHQRPILRWRYEVAPSKTTPLPQQLLERFYELYPALTGYFVQGAPVFLTANVNPNKGLANGTSGTMHSLSWDSQEVFEEMAVRIENAAPGEFVDLVRPMSINVEVSDEALKGSEWSRPESETMQPGKVIIPMPCNAKEMLELVGSHRVSLPYYTFAVDLAFVITFHKCQGRTINKVILDLSKQPGNGNVTYSSLYVGLSRVRKGADIRLLPLIQSHAYDLLTPHRTRVAHGASPLAHLLTLRQPAELGKWFGGFDEFGEWSAVRAMTNASYSSIADRRGRKRRRVAQAVTNTIDPNSARGINDFAFGLHRQLAAVGEGEINPVEPAITDQQTAMNIAAFARVSLSDAHRVAEDDMASHSLSLTSPPRSSHKRHRSAGAYESVEEDLSFEGDEEVDMTDIDIHPVPPFAPVGLAAPAEEEEKMDVQQAALVVKRERRTPRARPMNETVNAFGTVDMDTAGSDESDDG
jgi:hypothetical protein